MTDAVHRPLLFLDVDGVLIPFGSAPKSVAAAYSARQTVPEPGSNPLLERLNPAHGQRLLALLCDLVWATSWDDEANEVIAPRIGLPQLPLVSWSEPSQDDPTDKVHWKTRDLIDWAAGRPFVWVDDEVTDADRAWVSAHHAGPALLHRTDPTAGLTDADLTLIGQWLIQRQSASAK